MSSPTLAMTAQLNDSFNYALLDALSVSVPESVNLANLSKMLFGQNSNSANGTTTVPSKLHISTRTITVASSTLDIDISALPDIFNSGFSWTKVYYFYAKNNDASGGSGFILKPGPSNGWVGMFNGVSTSELLIQAGGDDRRVNPYSGYNVTSGSKILRIQNDAASPSGPNSVTLVIAGA